MYAAMGVKFAAGSQGPSGVARAERPFTSHSNDMSVAAIKSNTAWIMSCPMAAAPLPQEAQGLGWPTTYGALASSCGVAGLCVCQAEKDDAAYSASSGGGLKAPESLSRTPHAPTEHNDPPF